MKYRYDKSLELIQHVWTLNDSILDSSRNLWKMKINMNKINSFGALQFDIFKT